MTNDAWTEAYSASERALKLVRDGDAEWRDACDEAFEAYETGLELERALEMRDAATDPAYWERIADAAVKQIVDRMMARTLTEREKRQRDEMWVQLCAEAAFTQPGVEQVKLLERAARELVEREVDAEVAGGMLYAFAGSLGLGPAAVGAAIAAARRVL